MAAFSHPQSVSAETLTGTPDSDKHSIKVTGKGLDEAIGVHAFSNTLEGGDGNDKFDISTKHSGYSNIFANSISAGNDADKIKLATQSKSGRSLVDENIIDLGEGKDSLQIDTKSGSGDSDIFANTIVGGFADTIFGGDGDTEPNSVKLSASNKGSATGNDPGSVVTEDATIIGNRITTYDGADNHTLSAKSGDGFARISDNTIDARDGNNKIALSASNKGTPLEFINGGGIPYSHFATQAYIGSNIIVTEYGNDTISLTSKSSKSFAAIFSNNIQTEDGDDNLSLSSQGYTGSIAENTLSAGDGDDQISLFSKGKWIGEIRDNVIQGEFGDTKVTIKSQGDPVGITGNLIDTGHGYNEISVEAKAKGGAQISDNTISSGDYDDTVALSVSGEQAYIAMNNIILSAGTNEISLSSKAKEDGQITGNTLRGGDGDDAIALSVSGKDAYIWQNDISVGDDAYNSDAILLSGKAKVFGEISDNTLMGGDGDDAFALSVSGEYVTIAHNIISAGNDAHNIDKISLSGKAKEDSQITGNTLMGGDYTDQIIVDLSAKDEATFGQDYSDSGDGNIINAGDWHDTIEISLKGYYTDFRANTIIGGDGHDSISISLDAKNKNYNSVVDQNVINGDDGDDTISLDFSKGFGDFGVQYFLEDNTIDGGDGDNDTLVIGSKNQLIDLTTVTSGNLVDMEIIDLGKSKSSLFLDDSSVIAATDADNLLLITGKGSVDLGGSSTFINEIGGFSYFDLGTSTVGIESSIDVIEIV